MLDVSALVHQMHDTLSQIHETITSLDTKQHDEKLDALEAQRDSVLEQLYATYQKQREELETKRQSERDEVAEKRRKEDEEITARRKREDEELQTRRQSEDSEHEKKLEEEKKSVETETDSKMEEIETEAQRLLDEGHKKIGELEQKRRVSCNLVLLFNIGHTLQILTIGVQQEINSLIDEQMKAPLPPPPKRRRGTTRSAPAAQSAPVEFAEPAKPAPEEASREIASQEEAAPAAEPQSESREIVPETTSAEEPAPEKASTEEPVSEKAVEEPVPESAPQSENTPEETIAQPPRGETDPEEAKPDSTSTESPLPAQEDQPQENLPKDDIKSSDEVVEEKPAAKDLSEHQEEPTREIQEPANVTDSKDDVVEDQIAKPESSTADEQAHIEEEKPAPGPSEHQQEADREISQDAHEPSESKAEHPEETVAKEESHHDEPQAEVQAPTHDEEKKPADEPSAPQEVASHQAMEPSESKVEHSEDSTPKDDSHTSEPQAETKEPSQDDEKKPVDEPSVHQEEATREVQPEPVASKEEPVAEHDAKSSTNEPEKESAAKTEEPSRAEESHSTQDTSSAPEPASEPIKEEHAAEEHSDPSSEGIAKGGAAEDYLAMAKAKPESHHEEDGPAVNGAIERSEPASSSPDEQHATPQEKDSAESTGPAETREIDNSEVTEKGADSSAEPEQGKAEHVVPQQEESKQEEPKLEDFEQDNPKEDETQQQESKNDAIEQAESKHDEPEQDKSEEVPAGVEKDVSSSENHDVDTAEDVKESADSSAPAHEERGSVNEPAQKEHEETLSDVHEDAKAAEPQSEAPVEASKPEDHDAGDISSRDVGLDEHTNGVASQEHQDEPVAKDADQVTSTSQPEADSEPAAKSEAEPQLGDHNETKPETTEAEPVKEQAAVDSYDDSHVPSKDNEEQHSTEHSAEPQTVEKADTSSEEDHHEQHKEEPSLSSSTEHKGEDAQASRDLDGGEESKEPDHSVDHTESQPLSESAKPVEPEHPSTEQDALSVPTASTSSDPQQTEDTEVLEGSGNDQAPSRGLDVKDSEDHPAEENFDLSGNEPIPGTMTHGIDPEGADILPAEVSEKTADRELDNEAASEKPLDAQDDHAAVEKAVDSQQDAPHQAAHDNEVEQYGADDHVPEHQPVTEVQDTTSTDKIEPEEQAQPSVPSSHGQDSISAEGHEEPSVNSHETSDETLAKDSQIPVADHPSEIERPSEDTDADKDHKDGLTEEPSVPAEADKPSEHEAPAIAVTEYKADEDIHEGDSKPTEEHDESSSRDLKQPESEPTTAQRPADAWEDRHASSDARRPSTIETSNLHPDDDADAGLFAVPPTPRDEIDQEKPASLQAASPPQAAVEPYSHDTGASLPKAAEEANGAAHDIDSLANGHENGVDHKATEDHEEEDRTSLPPWMAQNGHSEELPQLHTGSNGRDIDASENNSAHSRDGSYHEDFKLSPVAYTPVEKKSKPADSSESPKEDGYGFPNGHDNQKDSYWPVEEQHDASYDKSQPDEFHETNNTHVDSEPQHTAVEHLKEPYQEEPSNSYTHDQHLSSTETPVDRSLDSHKDVDEGVPSIQHPSAYNAEVNYDGEGYGPSPTQEHHYDAGATAFPQDDHTAYSPGLATATSQSEARSSFSGHDTAAFSHSDDHTETDSHIAETPTAATAFDKYPTHDQADTHGQFQHALGNLPDESAHTVQGTDDLFDDDDEDDSSSEYGEAVVEPTEKLVYQANGSHENVALGGNQSSLSLGRNSMASQGSYGHHSAGSRSSFGSVRETTPLRIADGSYLATSPSIVRADWAGEHEDELRPRSRATPQLQPSTQNDTPGVSPFMLRNTPAGGAGALGDDERGLAASRWSPQAARPQTPPSNTRQISADSPASSGGSGSRLGTNNPFRVQQEAEEDIDPSMYMPRDVTNTPWHARNDSVPMSLHSQTTLSSAQESPIHSSLPVDRHEPVIRDSWPTPAPGYQQYLSSWGGRPRGDSSLSSNNGDYDPFKADGPGGSGNTNKSSIYNPFQQRGRAESSVSNAPSAVSASPSRGSGLFQKMRSVFEQGGGAGEAPPALTRPVSGTYHAVSPGRSPMRPEHAADSTQQQQQQQQQGEQNYNNRSGY